MKKFKTVCPHDCPDTCSIVAQVEHEKVISTKGDPNHPFTRGALCAKVLRYKERIYSPDRILYPMKRTGRKGEGLFERISWNEALDLIVKKVQHTLETFGGEAITYYKGTGTMGIIQSNIHLPFFQKIGASQTRGSLCCPAGIQGWEYTVGTKAMNRPESIAHTDLFIVWGMNMVSTNMHMLSFFQEAKKKGAKMIVIDPYRNRTAQQADWYIPIRPGTDTALALGMMHVLLKEDLIDQAYIDDYTLGFEELKKELVKYPPERVETITGIPAETVKKLARMYGNANAPFIRMGMGLSRNRHGGMSVRTIACLPGLVGAYHKKGGGAYFSSSGAFPINKHAVVPPSINHQSTRVLDKVRLGHHLLKEKNPPISILMVTNGNPLISNPDAGKVREGLLRSDLFTVVHEQFMTDTALYADIILPATSSFEAFDVYESYGHTYLQKAEPVINPLGEAWSNHKLYTTLAEKMGFDDEIFTKSVEEIAQELLPPNLSKTKRKAFLAGEPIQLVDMEKFVYQGFATPSGKLEFYSEQMLKDGYSAVPTYMEEEGEADGDLHLLMPPAHYTLNTSFSGVESLRKIQKGPVVLIHPEDGRERGIVEDGWVEVYNSRGSIRLWATRTENMSRGVIAVEGVWRIDDLLDGNPINILTSDRLTDMGWGSTLHDNKVFIKKVE